MQCNGWFNKSVLLVEHQRKQWKNKTPQEITHPFLLTPFSQTIVVHKKQYQVCLNLINKCYELGQWVDFINLWQSLSFGIKSRMLDLQEKDNQANSFNTVDNSSIRPGQYNEGRGWGVDQRGDIRKR